MLRRWQIDDTRLGPAGGSRLGNEARLGGHLPVMLLRRLLLLLR